MRIACIRNGVVENIVVADADFVQHITGFDVVGQAIPAPGGVTVNGVFYAAPVAANAANSATINARAEMALANFRIYRDTQNAQITNASTVAIVKELCRTMIAMIRIQLGALDGTD